MQTPRDNGRVHLTRLDRLQQLVGGQTLRHDDQILRVIERGAQALLKLLVTQAKCDSQARRLIHALRPLQSSWMRHFGRGQEQHVELTNAAGFGKLASLVSSDDECQAGDCATGRGFRIRGDGRAANGLLATNLVDLRFVEDHAGTGLVPGLVDDGDEYLDGVAGSQPAVDGVVWSGGNGNGHLIASQSDAIRHLGSGEHLLGVDGLAELSTDE
jgi:hypothetical protein